MEALSLMVNESLARHGIEAKLDHRRSGLVPLVPL